MKRIFLISAAMLVLVSIAVLTSTGNTGENSFQKKAATHVELRAGDVLFQDTGGDFGRAIKLATGSRYSHCAVVLKDEDGLFVYEAVEPVRRRTIEQWIAQGVGEEYEVRRMKDPALLTADALNRMLAVSKAQIGKHYDGKFEWNDQKIYCSELVWMVYQEGANIKLCTPRPMREYDLSSPEVKAQIEMRYGRTAPLDELMVSPEDLLRSGLLVPIEVFN